MKLTKAQRLFVSIGHLDKELIKYALLEKRCSESRGKIKPSHCRACLMQVKALRKKFIREALCEWEKEKNEAYHKGHKDGYDAGFANMWF